MPDEPAEVRNATLNLADRAEIGTSVSVLVDDPLRNNVLTGLTVAWHLDDLLAVEADGVISVLPWEARVCEGLRYTALACSIFEGADFDYFSLSHLGWHAHAGVVFTPIHGTLAIGRSRAELAGYVRAGAGVGGLQLASRPWDDGPAHYTLPVATTDIAGGVRVALSDRVLVRMELRTMGHIEPTRLTYLELDFPIFLQAGVSILTPARGETPRPPR